MTKTTSLLHGADYNPEQWLGHPGILDEDLRLMRLAGMNVMALGIFSWAQIEPEEGRYELDEMEEIIDRLYAQGVRTILATPSGARPAWMAEAYPEVMQVNQRRERLAFGGRHNHCPTSQVFREKVTAVNRELARRFADHPAILLWHVSNEYQCECYCETCEHAFRDWLKARYGSLEGLNKAWWADFWSATYTNWDQVRAPHPNGQFALNALYLDWKRFVSDLTIDFYRTELAPLREFAPRIPATTNFHPGGLRKQNLWKFAREVDVVSWDNYPSWHQPRDRDFETALGAGFYFDLMRSLGDRPFLMMESAPGNTVWGPLCTQKAPGLHRLSSIQAIAHGSDSVQYFQWRKSRGACEKWHAGVVDHAGHEHTRMFREVVATSETLRRLEPVAGAETRSEAAVLFDWENLWALESSNGPANSHFDLPGVLEGIGRYHQALVHNRVNVDFVAPDGDFSRYKILVAPLLYCVPRPLIQRLRDFVADGGTLVGGPLLSCVDENDLFHLGGLPGGLTEVFGVRAEEIHALPIEETVEAEPVDHTRTLRAARVIEWLTLEGAEERARFTSGIYAGRPAVADLRGDRGRALYFGAEFTVDTLASLLDPVLADCGVARLVDHALPSGVYATERHAADGRYLFLMNFTPEPRTLEGHFGEPVAGDPLPEGAVLEPWGLVVTRRPARSREAT